MSQHIQILGEGVARAITTQIVIQDVEMVVKELLENALDAGATRVKCVVEDCGTKISVSDDGPGIAPADLECVGASHSTSKLSSLEDLRRLSTYGFRGEGLHAIASQGVLRVCSRTRGAARGWGKTVSYAPGAELVDAPVAPMDGLPEGTTVIAENLFGTLPVRRQVMRERQEATHKGLIHMFTCYALAHPEVSFVLESPPKAPFVVSEARTLEMRCTDLYGPNLMEQMERVRWVSESAEDLWEFDCLLPKPGLSNYDHAVRSKPRAFALVNKRPVKLDAMIKLLNRSFRAHAGLGSRKYPMILLSLTLPPDTYDINLSVEKSKINLMNEAQLMEFLTQKIEDFYPPLSSQQSGSTGGSGNSGVPYLFGVGGALEDYVSPQKSGVQQDVSDVDTPSRPTTSSTPLVVEDAPSQQVHQFFAPRDNVANQPNSVVAVSNAPSNAHAPLAPAQAPAPVSSASQGPLAASQGPLAPFQGAPAPSKVPPAAPGSQVPPAPSKPPAVPSKAPASFSQGPFAPFQSNTSASSQSSAQSSSASGAAPAAPSRTKASSVGGSAAQPKKQQQQHKRSEVESISVSSQPVQQVAPDQTEVKRQKIVDADVRMLVSDVPQGSSEWIHSQVTAVDMFDGMYRQLQLVGAVCRSERVNLSPFQMLSARFVGVLQDPWKGFLVMIDGLAGSLVFCDSVAISELVHYNQLITNNVVASIALPDQIFLDLDAVGSPLLWDMIRTNHLTHRIFQKSGFAMDTRYFDTRCNAEVIKISHVPRCCPEGRGRDVFIELLKLIGVAHLENRLNEHARLHPKIILEYFTYESQRLAKADGVLAPQKAQDLLESLAAVVSTPAGSQRANELTLFKRIFQFQRGPKQ